MLTHEKFPEFEHDILIKKGVNLQTKVGDDDNSSYKVERFIDRVVLLIETEVKKYNLYFNYDNVDDEKKKAFYEACLEQALFLIATGDANLMSGYDSINNTAISVDEIRKRAMSPFAKNMLQVSGLLYRGIRTGYSDMTIPGFGNRRL